MDNEDLANLYADEVDVLRTVVRGLLREREFIEASQYDALVQSLRSREEAIARLIHLEEQMNGWTRAELAAEWSKNNEPVVQERNSLLRVAIGICRENEQFLRRRLEEVKGRLKETYRGANLLEAYSPS